MNITVCLCFLLTKSTHHNEGIHLFLHFGTSKPPLMDPEGLVVCVPSWNGPLHSALDSLFTITLQFWRESTFYTALNISFFQKCQSLSWRRGCGCQSKPPRLILSNGGHGSAAASWRTNSDTSTTDLLPILISFTFRSCFPREKSPNRPTLMLRDDFNSRRLVSSLLFSLPCCCHVEIRVHCGGRMSDVDDSEWVLWFFNYFCSVTAASPHIGLWYWFHPSLRYRSHSLSLELREPGLLFISQPWSHGSNYVRSGRLWQLWSHGPMKEQLKLNWASCLTFSVWGLRNKELKEIKLNCFKPSIYNKVQSNMTNSRLREWRMKAMLISLLYFWSKLLSQKSLK